MTKITEQLYIGDRNDAQNGAALHREGITVTLNVAQDCQTWHHEGILSLKIGLYDRDDPNNEAALPLIVDTVEHLFQAKHKIFVHCIRGRNRSAFVCAFCLNGMNMWPNSFFDVIQKKRPEVFTRPWMADLALKVYGV